MSPKTKARLAAKIAEDIRQAHTIKVRDPKTGKQKDVPDPHAATTLESGGRAVIKEFCPTGSMVLDRHILGVGGLAWGRIYELAGAESCLAGDTRISFTKVSTDGRRQNSKGGTIRDLYMNFHRKYPASRGGKSPRKDPRTLGCTYIASCLNEEGRIFGNRIVDVMSTGVRVVHELVTKRGLRIEATAEHKFFTGTAYVPLGNLTPGDPLMIHNKTPYRVAERKRAPDRAYLYVAAHPTAGIKIVRAIKNRTTRERGEYAYRRLLRSRAVVEARMNSLTLQEYVDRLNASDLGGLVFLRKEDHVHHRDENVLNDDPDNLIVISASEHGRLHALERHNNLRFAAVPDEVASIRKIGEKPTFDIRMASPFNNYAAAGFVVHNSGKTTLACRIMAEAQRDGAVPILTDKENKFHTGWAAKHGLSLEDCVEHPAPYVEAYFDEILRLLDKHGTKTKLMFVLDSIPALLPKAYIDGDLDDQDMPGALGKAWSRGMAKLSPAILEYQAILLVINQLRSKIGVKYGPTEDTPAGRALKHYASGRFWVYHGETIKRGEVKIGRYMKVKAFKNNLTGCLEDVVLKMMYETGFDDRWSVLEHAKLMGCIDAKAGDESYEEALANLGWAA